MKTAIRNLKLLAATTITGNLKLLATTIVYTSFNALYKTNRVFDFAYGSLLLCMQGLTYKFDTLWFHEHNLSMVLNAFNLVWQTLVFISQNIMDVKACNSLT